MARPDIREGGDIFEKLKESLVYRDEEVLETGILKVQPLQYLDEEILRYRDQIQASVALAKQVHDDVPEQLLSMVEHTIQKATEAKTTLYKASALLEFTSNIFLYTHRSTQDRFSISHQHMKFLDQFDDMFGKMMSARLNTNMEQAQNYSDKCVRCVENAVNEAKTDMAVWAKWFEEEEQEVSRAGKLDEVKEAVKESIRDEISELEMIKMNCSTDILSIDSSLKYFSMSMAQASKEYQQQQADRRSRWEKNIGEQKKLRKRLAELEMEKNCLEHQMVQGEAEERDAKETRVKARRQADGWQAKIVDLQQRVDTSLEIMRDMTGITDLILSEAQEKQRSVKEKLKTSEVECLLGMRDSLMANGVMCKLLEFDCRNIIKTIEDDLVGFKKSKQEAARYAHAKKVQRAAQDIDASNAEKDKFEKQSQVYCKKLDDILQALHSVDLQVSEIKPLLHLDSLQERYMERKKLMDELFADEESVKKDIQFPSIRQYF